MFKNKLDITKLFTDGYHETDVTKEMADKIYKQMQDEAWIEIKPEKSTDLDMSDKYYYKRHIAAQSILQPRVLHDSYKEFFTSFCEYVNPVLAQYKNGDSSLVTAYCGTDGYEMELHTDVSDRSVIDVILYIGGETQSTGGTGGTLEIYQGAIKSYSRGDKRLMHTVNTTHGKLIILNNMLPHVYHGVPRLHAPGARRYQLVANMGLPDSPNWRYPVPKRKGFINPGKPILLDDIQRIRELMA